MIKSLIAGLMLCLAPLSVSSTDFESDLHWQIVGKVKTIMRLLNDKIGYQIQTRPAVLLVSQQELNYIYQRSELGFDEDFEPIETNLIALYLPNLILINEDTDVNDPGLDVTLTHELVHHQQFQNSRPVYAATACKELEAYRIQGAFAREQGLPEYMPNPFFMMMLARQCQMENGHRG